MEEFNEFHTHDHTHGYTNGFQGIEQKPYETYIAARVSYDLLTKQIGIVEKTIDGLMTSLASINQLRERYQSALQVIPVREQKVKRCEEELAQVFQEEDLFRQQVEELRPRSLILIGYILFTAGVIFMIADFFISQTIVANALSMDKGLESGLFALGISSISILLKPVYDVVHDNRQLRQICLLVIAIVTLLTVGAMGYFRYNAYNDAQLTIRNDMRLAAIKSQLESSETSLEENPRAIIDLQKEQEKLTNEKIASNLKLTESNSSVLFFVLVGILFALAGAVCLSEGLHHFARHKRWKERMPEFPPYFTSFQNYRTTKQQNLTEEQNRLIADRVQLETAREELDALAPLQAKLDEQQQLLNKLEQDRLAVDVDNRTAYYQDGYERGKTFRESDEGKEEKKVRRITSPGNSPRQPRSAYKILADSIMTNFASRSNYNQNFELDNN